jgi:hypothetical protein
MEKGKITMSYYWTRVISWGGSKDNVKDLRVEQHRFPLKYHVFKIVKIILLFMLFGIFHVFYM